MPKIRVDGSSTLALPYRTEDQIKVHHRDLLHRQLLLLGFGGQLNWAGDLATFTIPHRSDRGNGDDPLLATNTVLQLVQSRVLDRRGGYYRCRAQLGGDRLYWRSHAVST